MAQRVGAFQQVRDLLLRLEDTLTELEGAYRRLSAQGDQTSAPLFTMGAERMALSRQTLQNPGDGAALDHWLFWDPVERTRNAIEDCLVDSGASPKDSLVRAVTMEHKLVELFRDAADRTDSSQLTEVFQGLARAHRHHRDLLAAAAAEWETRDTSLARPSEAQ